jgi:hypothetical protein
MNTPTSLPSPFVVAVNSNGTATVNGKLIDSLAAVVAEYGELAVPVCHAALVALLVTINAGVITVATNAAAIRKAANVKVAAAAAVQTTLDTHASKLSEAVAIPDDPAAVLASVKGLSDALNTQTSASRKAAHAKRVADAQAALAKLQAQDPE